MEIDDNLFKKKNLKFVVYDSKNDLLTQTLSARLCFMQIQEDSGNVHL